MASQSGQHPSHAEHSIEYANSRILQESAGQHQPNIIRNREEDSFSDDMNVDGIHSANDALDRMNMEAESQCQKENQLIIGDNRVSPSKRSNYGGKSPRKLAFGFQLA